MFQELYIRAADSSEAAGPYTLEKLQSLAEAGKVTPETLYFDDSMQSWVLIAANAELKGALFPERKRLRLRAAEAAVAAAEPEDAAEAYDDPNGVDAMLAAAEGVTPETRHLKEMAKWRHRSAAIAPTLLASLLLAAAAGALYPSYQMVMDVVETQAWVRLLQRPVAVLGLVDALLGIILLLKATEIYPLVRLRAVLGGGFFAVMHWAGHHNGELYGLWMALAMVGFGVGTFIATLTLNFRALMVSFLVALAGIVAYAGLLNFALLFPPGAGE